jgi:AraC-like DNA-binding protein
VPKASHKPRNRSGAPATSQGSTDFELGVRTAGDHGCLSVAVDPDDVLTDTLNALGLRSRIFCRAELGAPWALGVPAGEYAHFHIIDRGSGWLHLQDQHKRLRVKGGDLIVLPRGQGHTLSDGVAQAPMEIHSVPPALSGHFNIVKNGSTGAATTIVCGSFAFERRVGASLLLQLPEVLRLKGRGGEPPEWLKATLTLLLLEARDVRPGRSAVITRLTDILLIQVLRHWMRRTRHRRGWLAALADDRVGAALSALHDHVDRAWTVETLARHVGMSRSAFASRFKTLLHESPLAYLARWRMLSAKRLLQGREATLAEVATRVGYATLAAFSKAFKREFQTTPGQYRRRRDQ